MMTDLREHFSTLEDPRIDRNKRHELLDIVLVVICGMLSGADGWEAIEEFGKEKLRGCLGTHFRNSLKIGRLDKVNPLF
ncbi:DDE family transposase [Rhizobium sp. UGM030330-04]|nr:DDE family transposase [Rhizobium sp. UGM030330-04]